MRGALQQPACSSNRCSTYLLQQQQLLLLLRIGDSLYC